MTQEMFDALIEIIDAKISDAILTERTYGRDSDYKRVYEAVDAFKTKFVTKED